MNDVDELTAHLKAFFPYVPNYFIEVCKKVYLLEPISAYQVEMMTPTLGFPDGSVKVTISTPSRLFKGIWHYDIHKQEGVYRDWPRDNVRFCDEKQAVELIIRPRLHQLLTAIMLVQSAFGEDSVVLTGGPQ